MARLDRPLTIRITYGVVPTGTNGPTIRISCGWPSGPEDVQAWLYRYAQYAARYFPGAQIRQGADGGLLVVRRPQDGILATIDVEPETVVR
jgi:hypothetical protein